MNAFAAAGAGFLTAVLWFDLMFDVQARRGGALAEPEALASIRAYYRRVTTGSRPMGRLVQLVMLATLAAIVAEVWFRSAPWWAAWPSLAAALIGIGLARARTVRNAVRLGAGADPPDIQTRLARTILADHIVSLAAMTLLLGLQLAVQ
jgi:hypothetical protein